MKSLNDLCTTVPGIVDIVAPVKQISKTKCPILSPWIDDCIRNKKRECRKAERLWEKSKLKVNYDHMNFLLLSLNKEIKDAKAKYFSMLISANQHTSRFLFKTIDH